MAFGPHSAKTEVSWAGFVTCLRCALPISLLLPSQLTVCAFTCLDDLSCRVPGIFHCCLSEKWPYFRNGQKVRVRFRGSRASETGALEFFADFVVYDFRVCAEAIDAAEGRWQRGPAY